VERAPEHRAQAAVDELGRVLPGIIKEEIKELSRLQNLQQLQEQHSGSMSEDRALGGIIVQLLEKQSARLNDALAAHRRLLGSLCDFDVRRTSVRYAQVWS
jgi:hypothetical protein